MSRLTDFVKGLAPTPTGSGSTSRREAAAREHLERRRRLRATDALVEKQDVERRARMNDKIRQSALKKGAQEKPYDPIFLRDIAQNAVVQAYVDTLSQDVAGANWQIKPRDENADISDETLANVERRVKGLHPERPFRDVLESTTRVLLELGDATWVKHYQSEAKNNLAEIVVADSATFFKKVNPHGLTEGYVQASVNNVGKAVPFTEGEVVWFEWASRPDRFYGEGPLEKASGEIELLEELAEKERLDLMQGSPPGVISQSPREGDFGGMSDEEWGTFKEKMKLDEGQRHRVGYSKVPVEFTPLSSNYQELQILDRSKYWVTVLGAVMKVNPSYAGFDFENTNRATDESQQEAYAQRGFRVTLSAIEEAVNRQLIWPEYSTDVKFEFEREQTVGEKKTRADMLESQARAGKEAANAGLAVSYRDGAVVVEDGAIDEGNAGGSGGGGGGLFASTDDPNDADLQVDTSKADDEDRLSAAEVARLEEVLYRAHKRQIEPESLEAIEKIAWDEDEDVPEYVFEKIREVIDGAVFDEIESIAGDGVDDVVDFLKDFFEDKLTQRQGWSLDSMVDDLSDRFPEVDDDQLETVARTETTSILNEAREEGYKDREDAGEEFRFYWQGPDDSRTTDLCDELKELTNPDYDGESRSLDELVRIERELSNEHFPDLRFRKHAPHINCRHTFVRDVGASIDVDVPTAEEAQEQFEAEKGEKVKPESGRGTPL